jgi:proteasome alpha subunit
MQICTQSGGLRPFGVSLLIIGIDENGPKLYETDPTGIYFRYKATAIGEGENAIEEVLHKEYSEDMSIEDAIKLGIKALMKAVDNDFGPERLDCGYITTKDKSFTIMKKEEIDKKFKEVKENLDKKK